MKQNLIDPYIYRITWDHRDPGWAKPEEHIPHFDLTFVIDGEADYWCDGEHFTVGEGECAFLPRNSLRKIESAGGCEMIVIYFFLTGEIPFHFHRHIRVRNMNLMLYYLHSFNNAWWLRPEHYLTECQEFFYLILDELTCSCIQMPPNPMVESAKDYIVHHYDEPLSAQQLAEQLRLHPNYFGQLFQKHEGCTVREYITAFRIRKAMTLLKRQELSVQEVAAMTGFSDSLYFTKVFKNIIGQPPSNYRKTF